MIILKTAEGPGRTRKVSIYIFLSLSQSSWPHSTSIRKAHSPLESATLGTEQGMKTGELDIQGKEEINRVHFPGPWKISSKSVEVKDTDLMWTNLIFIQMPSGVVP